MLHQDRLYAGVHLGRREMIRRGLIAGLFVLAMTPVQALLLGTPAPVVTFVGSAVGTAANGGNATIALSGIAGLAPGDFLLVVGSGNPRIGSVGNLSTNGTTPLTVDGAVTNDVRAVLAYKFHDDDTTITVQGSGNSFDAVSGIVLAFRGVNTGTPLDATTTTATGAASAPNPASITTVTARGMVIAVGAAIVNDATPGSPPGYSTPVVAAISDTNASTTAAAYKAPIVVGAEDPGAFDAWASSTWVAFTVALRVRS